MAQASTDPRGNWLSRWWLALVGAALIVGGGLVYEGAWWSIPRGPATYTSADGNGWVVVSATGPFEGLQHLGEGLIVAGVVAVIATVVLRIVRRRRHV
jgi:hypothetical protein